MKAVLESTDYVVNTSKGHYKFYRISLVKTETETGVKYFTVKQWGRIGTVGQSRVEVNYSPGIINDKLAEGYEWAVDTKGRPQVEAQSSILVAQHLRATTPGPAWLHEDVPGLPA